MSATTTPITDERLRELKARLSVKRAIFVRDEAVALLTDLHDRIAMVLARLESDYRAKGLKGEASVVRIALAAIQRVTP